MGHNLIHFEWASKYLLRQPSNFVVLEGFLSTLLNDDIRIVQILDNEYDKNNIYNHLNRVDILAEDSKGELSIIEVQNNWELDYFHRKLYGVPKKITEYFREEYKYVKKLYSVNILYFNIWQGEDYVYNGNSELRGIHRNDVLRLLPHQTKQFIHEDAVDLSPEYYVIRTTEFDENIVTPLDEWIYFLKTTVISKNAVAKGLPEAREYLRKYRLDDEELDAYEYHREWLRDQKSVLQTAFIEGKKV
jgi:predicted transposase/invertase (TIGR01784 family)